MMKTGIRKVYSGRRRRNLCSMWKYTASWRRNPNWNEFTRAVNYSVVVAILSENYRWSVDRDSTRVFRDLLIFPNFGRYPLKKRVRSAFPFKSCWAQMACLNTLKQEIKTLESVFPKSHERFQIMSASVDELSCRFVGKNGKKYEIHANITVSWAMFLLHNLFLIIFSKWSLTFVKSQWQVMFIYFHIYYLYFIYLNSYLIYQYFIGYELFIIHLKQCFSFFSFIWNFRQFSQNTWTWKINAGL